MVMAGGAVATACRELAERAATIGAQLLQTDPAQIVVHGGKAVGPRGSRHPGGDRPHLVPAAAGPAGRRRSGRARGDRRLQAGARHRHVQLRDACGAGGGRSGDRRRRNSRLRHRRGRRQAGQSDDRRRPDLRRLRAGHRHCALRGDAVRRARASRSRPPCPTICCPDRPRFRRLSSITWRRSRPTRNSA